MWLLVLQALTVCTMIVHATRVWLCRTPGDLELLDRRRVDLVTNSKFVTFFRPDLALAPEDADGVIKAYDHGQPGVRHAAYIMDFDGANRTLPPPTIVIAASKADCKEIHAQLLQRADYQALLVAPAAAINSQNLEIASRRYPAFEGYAFECDLAFHVT